MKVFAPPPWHTWGTTQKVETLPQAAPGDVSAVSNQLAKITYKRPDSFHWHFHAVILQAPAAGIGDNIRCRVFFDLMVGIGRSNVVIQQFETLTWSWSDGVPAPVDQPLYTTSAVGHRSFDHVGPLPGTITRGNTEMVEIVAQDLQCSARVVADRGAVPINQVIGVQVTAHFAPKVHIRPDWFNAFAGAPEINFPGEEVGGR